MGISDETDRTLFIRNLDSRVTEELLFELFLQAGPLIKTKIPKDADGKQKSFGFAVYKHDVSAPYAMQLLDGTALFGRPIHVQFRSGSSHSSSSGNSQNSSCSNTPNPHGQRTPKQFNSPPYTPPQMQRSFSSPDNLQKSAMLNNMMWQLQMQQAEQVNGGFPRSMARYGGGGGSGSGGGGGGGGSGGGGSSSSSRQQSSTPHPPHSPQMSNSSRGHRYSYGDEQSPSRHQQHGRDSYHHQSDRSGNRLYDNRSNSRHYEGYEAGYRGYQDNRRRRY